MTRPLIQQQVTFLACPDLDAADAFYRGLLGLPLALDQGACRIYRVGAAGNAFLGFCARTDNLAASSAVGVILTLAVDSQADVDAWYRWLLGNGMSTAVERPPTFNPAFNIYHLFLRDPAGNLVEIQAFLDPRWPRANVLKEQA